MACLKHPAIFFTASPVRSSAGRLVFLSSPLVLTTKIVNRLIGSFNSIRPVRRHFKLSVCLLRGHLPLVRSVRMAQFEEPWFGTEGIQILPRGYDTSDYPLPGT